MNKAQHLTITLDGEQVAYSDGETIYEIAARVREEARRDSRLGAIRIPTLCYDERLEPYGSCRLCVVELEGARNPVASCTAKATPGMVIRTRTPELEQHRKTLLELVASENPEGRVDPLAGYASQELHRLLTRYKVDGDRFAGQRSGESRLDDDNPFILRDYDRCISCYRCVRVCAEQEGDYAISVANRGFQTQITTEMGGLLRDSDCTFCGQCVQTCPTGALADKKALRYADAPTQEQAAPRREPTGAAWRGEELKKTRSVCSYCGVGCSVDLLTKGDKLVGIQPAMDGPANEGALCVKGQYAFDFVQHEDRLQTPLVRGDDGELHPASWEEALDRAARGFFEAKQKHGRYSTYAVASGRAPSESAYLTQKFIRATNGTHYVDNCSRA